MNKQDYVDVINESIEFWENTDTASIYLYNEDIYTDPLCKKFEPGDCLGCIFRISSKHFDCYCENARSPWAIGRKLNPEDAKQLNIGFLKKARILIQCLPEQRFDLLPNEVPQFPEIVGTYNERAVIYKSSIDLKIIKQVEK